MNSPEIYTARAPSFFDGGLFGLVIHRFVAFWIVLLTFGIALPWAVCYLKRWEIRHTVIDGRRLVFTGTAVGLFGTWMKQLFFVFITLGIYALWVGIGLKKWVVKHTHFAH